MLDMCERWTKVNLTAKLLLNGAHREIHVHTAAR